MMRQELILLWLGLALLICLGRSQSVGDTQSQQRSEGIGLEQNKVLVRRWIEEGFNKRDLKVVDELFVENFIVNGRKVGRAALKQSMSRRFTAFPDLHVAITELLAEGDKVVIWYTAQGTQRGEFEGVRPTGKSVNWFGSDLLRIEGTHIVEGWFLDDSLGLMRQLGATLSPAPIQK
jgi:predicted ester cyclase